MSFQGQPFAFDSPAAAVTGLARALELGARPLRDQRVSLQAARGRFLARPAKLDRDSPPFDTAVMDGYAVRCVDLAAAPGGHDLPVRGESIIGTTPPRMTAGAAMRISTGAAMPPEADAVLPRETVREIGAPAAVQAISIDPATRARVQPGWHVRRRGENARTGSTVLEAGTPLHAAAIGTLASLGAAEVHVHARVRVAVVTTGEEIVPVHATPGAFETRDSNGPAVEAALATRAWIELTRRVHVRGEASELDAALGQALRDADAVVITGGISMGHRDPVRAAVERLGARVIFHGLPQRPGKPMLGAIARQVDGAPLPLFGLPGNPLSALVTLERVVVPVLAQLGGGRLAPAPRVRLSNPDGATLGLWWHRLVRLGAAGHAELVTTRSSGDVVAGGAGDGFIEVPPEAGEGAEGPFEFRAWPR